MIKKIISDEFWARVEPLIPTHKIKSDALSSGYSKAGRKPLDSRIVFGAILFAVRTDCKWEELKGYGFGCVFQTKLDSQSTANWTLIPRQTGQ